jgi:predicted DNA-binding protein (MmcQ/YjbR family)
VSQAVINYCLQKPAAMEDYPFGPSPTVMKVYGKMFALIGKDEPYWTISLKCDPVIAANLREQNPSIRPGYHMNKKHWNSITLDGSIPEDELFTMIDHSYKLVVAKIPKSQRSLLVQSEINP